MPVDRHLDIGSQLNGKKKSQGDIVEDNGEMLDDACDGYSGRGRAVVPLRMIKWRSDLVPRFERPNCRKCKNKFNHWIVILPAKCLTLPPFEQPGRGLKNNLALSWLQNSFTPPPFSGFKKDPWKKETWDCFLRKEDEKEASSPIINGGKFGVWCSGFMVFIAVEKRLLKGFLPNFGLASFKI